MYFHKKDKYILNKLVRKHDYIKKSFDKEKQNGQISPGLSFSELFSDINTDIHFSVINGEVYVNIGNNSLSTGSNFTQRTYSSFNNTMLLEREVILRIRLLQQLENDRYIAWIYSGQTTDDVRGLFYLYDKSDKDYVCKRRNMVAIPSMELIQCKKHCYRTYQERINIILIVISAITLITTIFSFVISI